MNQIFPIIHEEEKHLPFYITGIGANRFEGHVIRQEGYPAYQWLHTVKGKGKLIINKQEFIISENMGFFFFPGVPHEYYPIEEPWETHWVTFHGYALENLAKFIGFERHFVFNLTNIIQIEKILISINSILNINSYHSNVEASSLLYCFLLEARKQISSDVNKGYICKLQRLEPVIDYIDANFNLDVSLTFISSLIGITRNHLCRLFKEVYKMTIMDYILKLRIKKAKEYLALSEDLKVKDIGYLVGYIDISYFCSLFRKHEGITPLKFRLLHKKY